MPIQDHLMLLVSSLERERSRCGVRTGPMEVGIDQFEFGGSQKRLGIGMKVCPDGGQDDQGSEEHESSQGDQCGQYPRERGTRGRWGCG